MKELLKKISFFDFLKPQELADLLAAFDKQAFRKGDILITQGKTGEVFYILESGRLGVYQTRKLFDTKIADLEPYAFFGEMSLISSGPRTASVVALEDGVVLTLSRETFRRLIMANAHVAHLIRETARKREEDALAAERQERMGKMLDDMGKAKDKD